METVSKIKNDALRGYRKELKRIAQGVKRNTRRSRLYLDDMEASKRQMERESEDRIKKLNHDYSTECKEIRDVREALEDVDRELFGVSGYNGKFAGYVFTTERLLEAFSHKKENVK